MLCPIPISKQFWPLILSCNTVSILSNDSASSSPQTQRVVIVAQVVFMATMTTYYVRKPWPSNFDHFFFFEPQLKYCHMTQHRTLHKLSWLAFGPKPLLRQQCRYIWFKNNDQMILTPYSCLCHHFNTVTYSASNFPHTQWVVMVAQAVVMATMVSQFGNCCCHSDGLCHLGNPLD